MRYNENAERFIRAEGFESGQIDQIAREGLDHDYRTFLYQEMEDSDLYNGLTPETVQEHCQWIEGMISVQVWWDDQIEGEEGYLLRYFHWPSGMDIDVPLCADDWGDAVKESAMELAQGADVEWVEEELDRQLSM